MVRWPKETEDSADDKVSVATESIVVEELDPSPKKLIRLAWWQMPHVGAFVATVVVAGTRDPRLKPPSSCSA
jgi:hypothetical protein